MGARVPTTVPSAEDASLAKVLAADETIRYREESVEAYVARITADHGFDVIVDTIGGDNLPISFAEADLEHEHAVASRPWSRLSMHRRFCRSSRRDGIDLLRVEICDQGGGLNDAEKIFEPFFTTKVTGMGMGLAICYHGGKHHDPSRSRRISRGRRP
jgi:signal transduction histidine kinase